MVGRPVMSREDAAHVVAYGDDSARRREVLRETVEAFERAEPRDRYHRLAERNLETWRAAAEPTTAGLTVEVLPGDWGEVTAALTRKHGECFAVLNMANAYVPGGAYVEGAIAQEENLFRRSDCHFRITDEEYDAARDRYRPHMTALLSAQDGVVYLDTEHPRVCIRGPEDRSRPELGYRWLGDDEVFPFLELRAAARDMRDGSAFDEPDMRRRIAAQLDTLRRDGVRHAVLGAFGCGAFGNPADRVAALYREEIDRRGGDFSVIAFAIFAAGYGPDNYAPFAETLGRR
jgi:hypothetical protein